MDEWLCSSTHNKDNVDSEALDKCTPLARFISFVPSSTLLRVPQLFPPQVIQPVCDELAANWPVACPAAGTYETLAFVNTGVNNNNNNNCKSDHLWSDHPNLSTNLPSFGHDECMGKSVRKPTVHIWSGAMHMIMMLPEYNPNLRISSLVDSITTNVSNHKLKCASTPHDQGASRHTKRSNAKLSNHVPRMSKVASCDDV